MRIKKVEYNKDNDHYTLHVENVLPDAEHDHQHSFTSIAVADRMVVYGLKTPEEAVDHLLMELDGMINETARAPEWDGKTHTTLKRHLALKEPAIMEMHEHFTGEAVQRAAHEAEIEAQLQREKFVRRLTPKIPKEPKQDA